MTKLPVIKPQELVKKLRKVGFRLERVKGSHHLLRHHDGRQVVVPMHTGKVLKRGTLKNILEGAKLSIEEFKQIK